MRRQNHYLFLGATVRGGGWKLRQCSCSEILHLSIWCQGSNGRERRKTNEDDVGRRRTGDPSLRKKLTEPFSEYLLPSTQSISFTYNVHYAHKYSRHSTCVTHYTHQHTGDTVCALRTPHIVTQQTHYTHTTHVPYTYSKIKQWSWRAPRRFHNHFIPGGKISLTPLAHSGTTL